MAPKKDKGTKEDEKVGVFNEVERTFLELQIAECNRKIARLRSAVDEYEARNEELQQSYNKLDEDRADIIAYLKRSLGVKNEENNELKEKVKGLEEVREIEKAEFHETVTRLEKNFTIMKDQLTSENKLLAGKINTLEEFRSIRDDLMKKFEQQEENFQEQEMKYKRIIYNAEKKFVIGKDKLKKEMEARLLQLAQDFQDATELRIAASTHRVVRENIAISNELDNILSTQHRVTEQNEVYKENVKAAVIAKELAEEERDKAINKSVVQLKVIDQLTAAFENIKKEKGLFEKRSYDFETLQAKIEKLTSENDNLALQVRILEQNLHARLGEQNKAVVEGTKMSKERDRLRKILTEAAFAIQAALKLDQWAQADPAREAVNRQFLLSHLLEVISQYREVQASESLATVVSFSKVYEEGDLGFVPRSAAKKRTSRTTVTSIQQLHKQQQELLRGTERKSATSGTVSTSSTGSSLKTIPSIKIIPISEGEEPEPKPSIESFVTSTQSTVSTEEVSEEDEDGKSELEKQLLASKLEIQKSILKDLALSQPSFKMSRMSMSERPSSVSLRPLKKAVMIVESIQDIEIVKEVTEPEPDKKEKDSEKKEEEDSKQDEESKEVQEPLESVTNEKLPASEPAEEVGVQPVQQTEDEKSEDKETKGAE